jgi:TolB-like protein/Flp pilus assembly protein TadD
MNKLFTELRRRNIFRVAGVYALVGWLLMQIVSVMTPALALPDWVDSFFAILLLVGFPLAILLTWAFEMTPEGVKRTETVAEGESVTAKTGRMLDYVIVGGLVLVAAMVVWQGTRSAPAPLIAAKDAAPQGEVKNDALPQPHPEERAQRASKDEIALTNTGPSIAVLPFADFSSAKDQEYFANGISEELLNVLARIKGLRVASRTSAFAFKDREASIGEIAKALNVDHVLEGSIRKAGTTLRITAQLINTKSDEHMWSQTYDRPLTAENIFAIQDEIAAAIVGTIKGKLSLAAEPASARTESLEAYELYLRARQQMNKRLPDSLRAALKNYQQAIALDPEFAPAYSGLADTYLLMSGYTKMGDKEALDLARPNVKRALELAPNSAEALTSASFLANIEEKYDEAIVFADRAIAANPNYADAYFRKGRALNATERLKEALKVYQQARALDPLSAVILINIGDTQIALGDRVGARKTYEANMRWNPDSPLGASGFAGLLQAEGDLAGAHRLFKDAQALNTEGKNTRESLALIYIQLGMLERAEKIAKVDFTRSFIYLLRGENQKILALYQNKPNDPNLGVFLYMMGDFKTLYQGFSVPAVRKFWLKQEITSTSINSSAYSAANVAFALRYVGDADVDVFINKVDAYLGGDDPAKVSLPQNLEAGAVVQMAKQQPKKAYVWIDRVLDLGFADILFLINPAFDGLRDTPEFMTREKRMAIIIAKQRAAIEAKLADPKPNWVK